MAPLTAPQSNPVTAVAGNAARRRCGCSGFFSLAAKTGFVAVRSVAVSGALATGQSQSGFGALRAKLSAMRGLHRRDLSRWQQPNLALKRTRSGRPRKAFISFWALPVPPARAA
jgi:hypothetical protein